MDTVNEFVKRHVLIEYIESSGCYGLYPFQLYVEKLDGQEVIGALALGGNVLAVYQTVSKYIKEGAKKLYLAVDFPATLDIKEDFVAVFSVEDKEVKVFAIPYTNNGEQLPLVLTGRALDGILSNFKAYVKGIK